MFGPLPPRSVLLPPVNVMVFPPAPPKSTVMPPEAVMLFVPPPPISSAVPVEDEIVADSVLLPLPPISSAVPVEDEIVADSLLFPLPPSRMTWGIDPSDEKLFLFVLLPESAITSSVPKVMPNNSSMFVALAVAALEIVIALTETIDETVLPGGMTPLSTIVSPTFRSNASDSPETSLLPLVVVPDWPSTFTPSTCRMSPATLTVSPPVRDPITSSSDKGLPWKKLPPPMAEPMMIVSAPVPAKRVAWPSYSFALPSPGLH